MKIAVSPFALKRHWVPGRPYTQVPFPPERLVELTDKCFSLGKVGGREGIVLVPVPCDGITTPTVRLSPELLPLCRLEFEPRRTDEAPFKRLVVDVPQSRALFTDVVIYRADVLAENSDRSDPDADWEVVSVNGRITEAPEPITPTAMMRNMLGLRGGTKSTYTVDDLLHSILYWSDKAMASGREGPPGLTEVLEGLHVAAEAFEAGIAARDEFVQTAFGAVATAYQAARGLK